MRGLQERVSREWSRRRTAWPAVCLRELRCVAEKSLEKPRNCSSRPDADCDRRQARSTRDPALDPAPAPAAARVGRSSVNRRCGRSAPVVVDFAQPEHAAGAVDRSRRCPSAPDASRRTRWPWPSRRACASRPGRLAAQAARPASIGSRQASSARLARARPAPAARRASTCAARGTARPTAGAARRRARRSPAPRRGRGPGCGRRCRSRIRRAGAAARRRRQQVRSRLQFERGRRPRARSTSMASPRRALAYSGSPPRLSAE